VKSEKETTAMPTRFTHSALNHEYKTDVSRQTEQMFSLIGFVLTNHVGVGHTYNDWVKTAFREYW